MKRLLETDKDSKHYTTVFSNSLYQIIVKVHDGKTLPHDKYTMSLIHLSLLSPSVSMAAAKITNFALYEPELTVTDIQAGLWTKIYDDITDPAALLVPSPVSFIF
jgi:hypothetical protein